MGNIGCMKEQMHTEFSLKQLMGRDLMEDLDTKHIGTVVIFLVCVMEVPSFSLC
jgi:hypothetical protein